MPSVGSLNCPCCVPSVPLNVKNGQHVLEHIGAHILHDPGVDKTWPVCGFCLQPPTLCQYFVKKSMLDTTRSKGCLLSSLLWNYALALWSTARSRCTNTPIMCPLCPSSKPAVWQYFMEAHFDCTHPSADCSNYQHLWTCTELEDEKLTSVWNTRLVVPKK